MASLIRSSCRYLRSRRHIAPLPQIPEQHRRPGRCFPHVVCRPMHLVHGIDYLHVASHGMQCTHAGCHSLLLYPSGPTRPRLFLNPFPGRLSFQFPQKVEFRTHPVFPTAHPTGNHRSTRRGHSLDGYHRSFIPHRPRHVLARRSLQLRHLAHPEEIQHRFLGLHFPLWNVCQRAIVPLDGPPKRGIEGVGGHMYDNRRTVLAPLRRRHRLQGVLEGRTLLRAGAGRVGLGA